MAKILLVKQTETNTLEWAINKGLEFTNSDKRHDQLSCIVDRLSNEALTMNDLIALRDYLKGYQTTDFEKVMLSKLESFITQQ